MFELSSISLSFRQRVVKHSYLSISLIDRLLLFRDGFLVLFLNLLDTVTDQPFDDLDEITLELRCTSCVIQDIQAELEHSGVEK